MALHAVGVPMHDVPEYVHPATSAQSAAMPSKVEQLVICVPVQVPVPEVVQPGQYMVPHSVSQDAHVV